MHLLSTLVKALALTIAVSYSGQAFANQATTPATPSVEAPVASPTHPNSPLLGYEGVGCVYPDAYVGFLISAHPEADIVSLSSEPPLVIVFTEPNIAQDLRVEFDENNCLAGESLVSKVNA